MRIRIRCARRCFRLGCRGAGEGEGSVTLSDAPGLGIEPDLERLALYLVRLP